MFFNLLDQNTCCFTLCARMLYHQSNPLASYTLKMHNDRILSVNCRSWTSTGQATRWCCARLAFVTMTWWTGGFFVKFKQNLCSLDSLQEVKLNCSYNIFSFSFLWSPLCVSLMISSGLIFEDIIIELIKRIFIKPMPPASALPCASRLIIILPLFILIRQYLIRSIDNKQITVWPKQNTFEPSDQDFYPDDIFAQLYDMLSLFPRQKRYDSLPKFLNSV